ncbi:thiamine pyrophosphate-dependent enzyme [Pontibacter silvestris]|uniref:Thiamine pyrophosphate-dependent enzyme n=1 Tax=Pontibacter silvestris TaxID=2305183 RepID=A0ABW4X3Q4_9BACT|nr:dehydrogenase E1 component subunit alpha/beta [Pontibacter silvestris]MCC9135903.1 dehydrogenase E1 component subunit alpha/beta [Pontibacter silvestris]
MNYNRKDYTDDDLLALYKAILKPRMIEERMLVLLRQGKVSKWFSGIGQEAVSVGSAMALDADEYILPLHRNLGVFTSRNIPLDKLFAQFQGKKTGFTKGRDRSFHFGSKEHHIVGMISHLGPQLAVGDGIALADLLDRKEKVTLVFSGDGGASEGDFHEALNVAAVWGLPVIFIVENNGYGLSTPNSEQFKFRNFIDKGPAYGIDALQIDGNNIVEVYHTVRQAAISIRKNPRPMLIEALTFRMRGHEETSSTKYVPQELFEKWSKKDPVETFESYLLEELVLTPKVMNAIKEEIRAEIEDGLQKAFEVPMPEADRQEELGDMYQPFNQEVVSPASGATSEKRYVDAISDGLRQSMERFPELVLMGQDIAEYGGVFKVTEGFVNQFGKDRVRNTPLCESAIVGIGLGMSVRNKKSMVEMQFADFVTSGFNQIVNNLAKSHYRWGQHADVVIRMPTGAGAAAGPFHSQSNEAWFFHTPGLKVVYPSSPYDAKGLLNAAIEDPNPVMFFEHKLLYRSVSQEIPDDYYTIEIGKARLVAEGTDFSIITYGMGVHWAKQVLQEMPEISADVLDLRSLLPWDKEAVRNTVANTGRVIVLHEDTMTGGIGGEIAAWIGENCFELLDGPVMRVASLDTAVPFAPPLEQEFLPKQRLREKVEAILAY